MMKTNLSIILLLGLAILGCSENEFLNESQKMDDMDYLESVSTRASNLLFIHKFESKSSSFPIDYTFTSTGPSKISIRFEGQGTLRLSGRGITKDELDPLICPDATFKWGIGNNVRWNIHMKYHPGGSFKSGTVYISGEEELELPVPDPMDPQFNYWQNHLPTGVFINRIWKDTLEIRVTKPGIFLIHAYEFIGVIDRPGNKYHPDADYRLVGECRCWTAMPYHMPIPGYSTIWVAIYEETTYNNKTTIRYIGDRMFPNPDYYWP